MKNSTIDKYLIQGIRNHDSEVLSTIYKEVYPMILGMVNQKSGSEADAQDIFQRTLLAFYEKLHKQADFQLSSKLSTYLYSIAQNLWLNEIRKKKPESLLTEEEKRVLIDIVSIEVDLSKEDLAAQRHLMFWQSFEKLGKDCKALLRQFFEEIESEKIASSLGITYGSYRVKKTRCIQKLSSIIKAKPGYKELKEDDG